MITFTPGFTVVDYQATPSGYYQISFRSSDGRTITATQHGNGGCVLYTPRIWEDELFTWLQSNEQAAIDHLNRLGYPELAQAITDKESEWEDSVVLSIVDLLELVMVRVQG
jgi:hypothetical protein